MLMMHKKNTLHASTTIQMNKNSNNEKEKSRRQWIIAIVDCSILSPNTHDLFNFGWAYFGCYSNPLSPATSPTSLTRALYGQPEFC